MIGKKHPNREVQNIESVEIKKSYTIGGNKVVFRLQNALTGMVGEKRELLDEVMIASEKEHYTKEIASAFADLGVSPAGIPKDMVSRFGVDYMEGIYHRIIAEYPRPRDKRVYHTFPVPHQTKDGRYKATITLYETSGARQLSIAGRTLEDYEEKVCQRLKCVYLKNKLSLKSGGLEKRQMTLKSAESILHFRKVLKSDKVKMLVDSFIDAFDLENSPK